MTVQANPYIITSTLVLSLDASNPRSYPGSGSVWYDISGNNNHFTLYNSPSYTSGYLSFDGVNDYAASSNNINLSAYDYVVMEIWFAANTTESSMLIEHTTNWNSQTGGWGLAINSNGTANEINTMHTNHNTEAPRNYILAIGTNWNCQTNLFSRISDSTGRVSYGNGSVLAFTGSYGTSTVTTAGGSFPNAIIYIASRAGTGSYYNGKIGNVKIYGFKITADNVAQNFDALRGRYGI